MQSQGGRQSDVTETRNRRRPRGLTGSVIVPAGRACWRSLKQHELVTKLVLPAVNGKRELAFRHSGGYPQVFRHISDDDVTVPDAGTRSYVERGNRVPQLLYCVSCRLDSFGARR